MAAHNELGKKGEELAVDYLKTQGYQILETNWQFKKFELDIVARKKNILKIVEVKSRSSHFFEEPHQTVSLNKQRQLVKAASAYCKYHRVEIEVEFDVVAVLIHPGTGTPEIQHFEEAFYPLA